MASFSTYRLSLTHGDTDYLDGAATMIDGTPQALHGWTIIFTAKRSHLDADVDAAIYKSSLTFGIVITNANLGLYTVEILPADTSALPNRQGSFYGGVVGIDPLGGVNTLWKGMIDLDPTPVLSP